MDASPSAGVNQNSSYLTLNKQQAEVLGAIQQ